MKRIFCFVTLILAGEFLFGQELRISQPVRYLALGDSYTIGQSVPPDSSFPQQLFSRLAREGFITDSLKIIAQTGWRTDNLANAISANQPLDNFNLVSLLIGVNDQYQGISIDNYPQAFTGLLETAIELAGGNKSKVFVLSIPDYAYTYFGGGNLDISEAIESYNSINRQIASAYGITYFNITPISQQALNVPNMIAFDGLHPSGRQYKLWVNNIMQHIIQHNNPLVTVTKEPLTNNKVHIFPNPASDVITIQMPLGSEAQFVALYSLQGTLIKKIHSFHSSELLQIPVMELEENTYLLYIKGKNNIIIKQLIWIY